MQIKTLYKSILVIPCFFIASMKLVAQEQPAVMVESEDTLENTIHKIQSDVEVLKRLKVTGYVQAQFQFCDSTGINTYAGGNFAAYQDKRFMIRRGRVKFAYTMPLSSAVVQLDATEKGVSIIEAYVVGIDPWLRAFSVTAGVFNRPFGYEVPYSSSARESPERGRMSQIIFPGERDLGAMLTFQMPKESPWNWFKIQGGMFNGTGRTASDFDTKKDFIGQLVIAKANKSESMKFSGGLSYYDGGVRQFTKKVYSMSSDSTGPIFHLDTASSNNGAYATRKYVGADFQYSVNWIAGVSTIRAEYIQGTQPGTSSSSTSPTAAASSTSTSANLTTGAVTTTTSYSDVYSRSFNGAYFYFTQNIMQSKHQIVVKYDWYDPNTEVSAAQIHGGTSKTGSADIKYTTIGIGYIFHWDQNLKLMVYYDKVTNENTKVIKYTKDLKDNVLTMRLQYKF